MSADYQSKVDQSKFACSAEYFTFDKALEIHSYFANHQSRCMRKLNTRLLFLLCLSLIVSCLDLSAQSSVYYPPPGDKWETKTPEQVGMDANKLQEAIAFAKEIESQSPRDLEEAHYLGFGREPFGDAVGPHKTRGDVTGIIVRNGYIVAEWGEPKRVDMTFSVSKSFLSSTVGVAFDQGLIHSLDDKVHDYMAPVSIIGPSAGSNKADQLGQSKIYEPFDTPHNRKISWNHLLRQTSDWEGTLWGKPDWADRPNREPQTWINRERHEPGTHYKYNDVRVNVLALAATNIWRRPLPQVLKQYVMDPIGASQTWRWHGYENSWILMDGVAMQVVSGGGHWGGGMMISARDQARFGYLTLRRGKWKDQQILSEEWVKQALTPTKARKTYGFMNWFVNTDKEYIASAPETAFAHIGAGTNMVYVDPEHDLVIVARWINRRSMSDFVGKVLAAIKE